jgi:TatD DNase family protein
LGEIGLDKVFGTNLVLQQHVFDKQIEIANEYHRKVLIIHCVKSYEEILKARQKAGKNQIWVLHGFNGGEALIKQLVKANFYFSIGATLFNPKSRLVKNLQFIPPERLFLETDDSNLSIKQVFDQFALLRKMDSASIQQQIRSNLTDVFGDIAEVT